MRARIAASLILVLLLLGMAFAECRTSVQNVGLNITTATDTTVIAGQPGKKIYVWQFAMENNHASTDVTVTVKDGSAALNGGGNVLKAGGGAWMGHCSGTAYFATQPGNSLVITTSAAGTISGSVQYSYE